MRQQGHLRALAGDVAGGDDAQHRQLRHQADPDRRGGGEVAAERARRAAPAGRRGARGRAPRAAASSRWRSRPWRTAARGRRAGRGTTQSRPGRRRASGRCSTNTRSSPILVSRSARRGRDLRGDLVGARTARWRRAGRPGPARRPRRPGRSRTGPRGSTSPITCRLDAVAAGSSLTTSIAPSAARMPHRIAPPSNAGPAGAAVDTMRSPSLSTISQLVPTSMNSRVRLSRSMPVASMPGDDVAADVGAERREERRPGPRVQRQPEVGGEHGRRRARWTCTNGATPSGSGSMPSSERGHRRVAGERHLVDVRPGRPRPRAQTCAASSASVSRPRPLQPAERRRGPSSWR